MTLLERSKESLSQLVYTLLMVPQAIRFTQKHKLWIGFWRYGWVAKFLVGIAILIGLRYVILLFENIFEKPTNDPVSVMMGMGIALKDFAEEGFEVIADGSFYYVLLILLEIVIFHVCRRTMEILTKKSSNATFDDFVKAQVRMIKVAVRSWVMQSIATILIKAFFGIHGYLTFMEPILIFGVQCYYLGFAVIDNYTEQFHLSIHDSSIYARKFVGVVLALGLMLNVLLPIPIVGVLLGPVLAAVTVSLVMYQIADLHILGEKLALQLQRIEQSL
ncbi:MAG: hypothetical protein AAF798_13495 [Bacteroidota bacterium]